MSYIANSLNDYYSDKRELIERSVYSIFPPECTSESMNHIVGPIDLEWDFKTLQKAFFTPVYEYLNKRTENIISLSTCLFLEAAGMELEKFIPILAIPVFFETSNEIFQDIADWTNMEDRKSGGMSALDISIKGNASIALLTLPSHNLLFHRLDVVPEKSLKLYESLTTNVFNSLFGNGIKLFWEQSKKIPADYNEYYEAAALLNKGLLRFSGDLWLIFHEKTHDDIIISAMNNFIEKRAVSIQLERDLLSFEKMQTGLNESKEYLFNPLSNFLFIHAAKKLNSNDFLHKRISAEYSIELINRAESVKYVEEQINELKRISDNALELLPIEEYYKGLLKSYCDYLVVR